MGRRITLLMFLVLALASSCEQKKESHAQTPVSVPQRYWQNARTIQIPAPVGAKSPTRWQFQAVIDDNAVYVKFIYPQKLPKIATNLAGNFEPTDESLNYLPYIKFFIPPESIQSFEERPKITSQDGDKLAYSQVGDPEPDFAAHVQFFLRSKNSTGAQKFISGGRFEKNDILDNPTSVVIGIQAYVENLRTNEQSGRIDFHYEQKTQPGPFITDSNSVIFRLPLAEPPKPFLKSPLPDLSLRLYPSGTNRYAFYIPEKIRDK